MISQTISEKGGVKKVNLKELPDVLDGGGIQGAVGLREEKGDGSLASALGWAVSRTT